MLDEISCSIDTKASRVLEELITNLNDQYKSMTCLYSPSAPNNIYPGIVLENTFAVLAQQVDFLQALHHVSLIAINVRLNNDNTDIAHSFLPVFLGLSNSLIS